MTPLCQRMIQELQLRGYYSDVRWIILVHEPVRRDNELSNGRLLQFGYDTPTFREFGKRRCRVENLHE